MAGFTSLLLGAGLAMNAVSAFNQYENAEDQANALAREGALKAKERDKQTRRLAGQQKSSFLSSGISLEGVDGTVNAILSDTYKTGLEDVDLIKKNYNNASKSTIGQARANLIGSLGKTAISAYSGFGGLNG